MQLVWAENVVRHTNKPVLILTPLAVAQQTVQEADKFGMTCRRSRGGEHDGSGIWVTNYEQLHKFDAADFAGVVCDESSAIKNFKSKRKALVTDFMRLMPYRLLCTATAAPNDYYELGTSSEALGRLGFMDMIGKFFKQETSKDHRGWGRTKYRFREHALTPFWRWVSSWARACRMPSDLGFDDGRFALPPLNITETVVECDRPFSGMLFTMPAFTLQEQREERRITLKARCETMAAKVDHDRPAVCWCHLNAEADMVEKMIPDAKQVSGSDSDDSKEEKMIAFAAGELRVLVIKPKIGAWGLNWQHCNHMAMFPSYSYEQYYQSVRRCWRFGQERPVGVDIITTEGEQAVLRSLQRKTTQADDMFTQLTSEMGRAMDVTNVRAFDHAETVPQWM
jgi:hypothetical protein